MQTYQHDGLTFDVRDSGPSGGEAVVCLHGFPQDGSAYDGVAPLLAAEGLRVLAPDQRGYSPGARPDGRDAYAMRHLVGDVVALLDAAGVERAHVVGHDWGGSVAWALAAYRPERVASLTALSTPHPEAMRSAALHGQAVRSSYMAFFQLPWLPEAAALAGGGAVLRASLTRSGLSEERAAHYVERMREPGALSAALQWYRALGAAVGAQVGSQLRDTVNGLLGNNSPAKAAGHNDHSGRTAGRSRVGVPTTYLVGLQDPFFSRAAVDATPAYVDAAFTCHRLEAGHWLPETHPDEVAAAVLAAQ